MSLAWQFLVYLLILYLQLAKVKSATTIKQQVLQVEAATIRQGSLLEWLQAILNPAGITTTTTPAPSPPAEGECATCQCGHINHHRIVGGQETVANTYPWMAMLLYNNQFYCGATLINDRYVLTAAHCAKGFSEGSISVRLLEHDRKNSSVYAINRRAAAVFIHERFSFRTLDNDLALIRLSAPVEWNEQFRPVCLPTSDLNYAGENATVTGWGAIREGGATAGKLQEVEVPILSQEQCHNSSYDSSMITENMLCAGFDEGGKDSCQGDSGGPLHVRIPNTNDSHHRHILAGIVSWGEGCARPQTPGVYTRVSRYIQWIAEHTRDACNCNMMEVTTEQACTSSTEGLEKRHQVNLFFSNLN